MAHWQATYSKWAAGSLALECSVSAPKSATVLDWEPFHARSHLWHWHHLAIHSAFICIWLELELRVVCDVNQI